MQGLQGVCVLVLVLSLGLPDRCFPQQSEPQTNGTYKLTILKDAATIRRMRKSRVSSQAVVKVTDRNNVPVAGSAVTFSIPQGSAAFAHGALTSVASTNAMGVATSGTYVAASSSTFSIGVSVAVPGGLSGAVPVVAGAATVAAVSTGVVVGIVAGAAAVAGTAVGVIKASSAPHGSIGVGSGVTLGPPR